MSADRPKPQSPLADIQAQADGRGLALDHAGVSGLRHPIVVATGADRSQPVLADLRLSVDVPHHQKGAHMSRFVEAAQSLEGPVDLRAVVQLAREVRGRLGGTRASSSVDFRFVLERAAPISGARAYLDYGASLRASVDGEAVSCELRVEVPVTTLCPCSKAISDYGAHNQRGIVELVVHPTSHTAPSLEQLVEAAEASGSSPVYPLLKRIDERHVTMLAYDQPRFVEDVAREAAARLIADERISAFFVSVRNEESIHHHAAFAELSWRRPQ